MGSYDIFKSELVDGQWGTPVNLGYPINTVNEESTFSLTADNSKLFVAAEYEDSQGERDIYLVDVSNYGLISKGYDKSTFASISANVSVSGSLAKKATIKFYNTKSDRFVGETLTNKEGKFKISLPGDETYRVEIIYKGQTYSKSVDAALDADGETQLKFSWSL